MSVIMNARGTSVPYFTIGTRGGTTLYQGASDPSGTYTIKDGDVWFDTTNTLVKMRALGSWSARTSASLSSVDVAGTNGIGSSGGPITSSGTITLSLGNITPTSVVTGAVTGSAPSAFGGTASTNAVVNIGTSNPLTGTAQAGIQTAMVLTNQATVAGAGFTSSLGTAAAVFTAPYVANFVANAIAKGAGSTITNAISFFGAPQTVGTNNAVLADSTTFTGSYFINQSASGNPSVFNGTVSLSSATFPNLTANAVPFLNGSRALSANGTFIFDGNGLSLSKPAGIGGNYSTIANLTVTGSAGITSATQYGINVTVNPQSTTTTAGIGVNAGLTTTAGSYTIPYVAGFACQAIALGAGSAVTRAISLYTPTQVNGVNNATLSDNLAFTGNWLINQSGTNASTFGGNVSIGTTTSASKLTVSSTTAVINAQGMTTTTAASEYTASRSGASESAVAGQGANIQLTNSTNTTAAMIQQFSNNIQFFNFTGGVWNERLRITSAGVIQDGAGLELGYKDVPRNTSALARGQVFATAATFTLNTGFAAGQCYTVYNDSAAAITLTQGVGLTLRLAGTTTTGDRTLAARGMATIWCNTTAEYIVSGPGVT